MSEVSEGDADESYNLFGGQRMGLVLDCFFQPEYKILEHVCCSDPQLVLTRGASQYSTELEQGC